MAIVTDRQVGSGSVRACSAPVVRSLGADGLASRLPTDADPGGGGTSRRRGRRRRLRLIRHVDRGMRARGRLAMGEAGVDDARNP